MSPNCVAIFFSPGQGLQAYVKGDSLPHALASLAPGGHIALIGGLGGFGGNVAALSLLDRTITALRMAQSEQSQVVSSVMAKSTRNRTAPQ